MTRRLLGDAEALGCPGGVLGDPEASQLITGSIRHPRDRSAHLQLHTGYRRFRCPAHRLPRTESGVHGRMPPLFPRELHIRNASHHRPPQDPLPALFRDDESDLALFRDDKRDPSPSPSPSAAGQRSASPHDRRSAFMAQVPGRGPDLQPPRVTTTLGALDISRQLLGAQMTRSRMLEHDTPLRPLQIGLPQVDESVARRDSHTQPGICHGLREPCPKECQAQAGLCRGIAAHSHHLHRGPYGSNTTTCVFFGRGLELFDRGEGLGTPLEARPGPTHEMVSDHGQCLRLQHASQVEKGPDARGEGDDLVDGNLFQGNQSTELIPGKRGPAPSDQVGPQGPPRGRREVDTTIDGADLGGLHQLPISAGGSHRCSDHFVPQCSGQREIP